MPTTRIPAQRPNRSRRSRRRVDAAQPGDTIWVKAGDYEEPVEIEKAGAEDRGAGAADKSITLSAWKDDRVRIGYQPRPLPVEGEWLPIPGSKSWQIKLTQDMPKDFLVLLDGKPILTWTQDSPPKDEKVNWAAYRKSDRTLMFNANGKNPKQLGKFEYGRRMDCFRLLPPTIWWVIRKIEFSWAQWESISSATTARWRTVSSRIVTGLAYPTPDA